MRKVLSFLLSVVLLLSTGVSFADDMTEENSGKYEDQSITVGNPTPLDGHFFTELWSCTTSDLDVLDLIQGYRLVCWDRELGSYRVNHAVVSGFYTQDDAEGNRSYYFALCKDLKYSDETEITAWDYAFSILFELSPEVEAIGANKREPEYILGYTRYMEEKAVPDDAEEKDFYYGLAGVRVLNDHLLKITVKHEYLPYFFELQRFAYSPYPIHVIAPGCKVFDTGKGVYIWNEREEITVPVFTSALLETTLLDKKKGFLAHPSVSSGPYVLTSYEGKTAEFDINEYYKGYEEDKKGLITHITYTVAENSDMMDKFEDGEFDLLNKVTNTETIRKGFELISRRHRDLALTAYPRIGLTYFMFNPDHESVSSLNMRRAIAHCLDKENAAKDYTGNYGIAMDGLFGLGTWMRLILGGNLGYPIPETDTLTELDKTLLTETWESLNLDDLRKYEFSTGVAVQYLAKDGWVLNAAGEAFNSTRDTVRYRLVPEDEEAGIKEHLEKLSIRIGYPDYDLNATMLTDDLLQHLEACGFEVRLIPFTMDELTRFHLDGKFDDVDLYYTGDNFEIIFDTTNFFRDGIKEEYEEESLLWTHALLQDMSVEMCATEPLDVLGYVQKWIDLQEDITEYLPVIPVYGNVYYDFYIKRLHNYDIYSSVTWSEAILDSYLSEIDEKLEAEEIDFEFEFED